MRALVTDSHLHPVVAGIRGLGRAGVDVIALGPRRAAAGGWSRYTSAREVGPDAASEPERLAARVRELSGVHGPLVVYPGSEAGIDAILGSPLHPRSVLPYPGPESLRRLRDKARLPELARAAGLATPVTLLETTAGELARATSPPLPCAVKPVAGGHPGGLGSTRLFDTAVAMRTAMGALSDPSQPLLVQEKVAGPLTSLSLVVDRSGRAVARFQERARQTWPDAAGSISSSVSVTPDEALVDAATDLLRNAGYWGLAQFDLLSGRDGHVLIDVNPRFYGCMPLALACGVNLPATWHAVVLGHEVAPQVPYRLGVSFRWLEGDAKAAVRGHPRRLLRRAARPAAGAFWASDDRTAGVALTLDSSTRFWTRRLSGRREA